MEIDWGKIGRDQIASGESEGEENCRYKIFDVVRSNFDIPSNVFHPPIPDQIKSEFA